MWFTVTIESLSRVAHMFVIGRHCTQMEGTSPVNVEISPLPSFLSFPDTRVCCWHSRQWWCVIFSHPFSCFADLPLLTAQTFLRIYLPTLVWSLYSEAITAFRVVRLKHPTAHIACVWYSPPSTHKSISWDILNSQLAEQNGPDYSAC